MRIMEVCAGNELMAINVEGTAKLSAKEMLALDHEVRRKTARYRYHLIQL
jgi:hypothetical protein